MTSIGPFLEGLLSTQNASKADVQPTTPKRSLRLSDHRAKTRRGTLGLLNEIMRMQMFDGPVWRLLPATMSASPASAPEGRFHHDGQIAAYASLSAERATVAIQRYLSDGTERIFVPMWLKAEYVADVRGDMEASKIWQNVRDEGKPSPTWLISDAARQAGAQAILYSSRSRPDLTHVVVFRPELLGFVGPISRFNG